MASAIVRMSPSILIENPAGSPTREPFIPTSMIRVASSQFVMKADRKRGASPSRLELMA